MATFPGAVLEGKTVRALVTDARAQAETQIAFHNRFRTAVLMTCMDLSVEAEAFGAHVVFSDIEVPTVTGRLVTDEAGVAALGIPAVGTARTAVYLEAARLLAATGTGAPVMAGMIGPFSLAGRLFGVGEALQATAEQPELVEELVAKTTEFLIAYSQAFRDAGAQGVIIAEPSAGLLSPRGLAKFSSPYVKKIIQAVESPGFEVVLHNCAAKALHLDAVSSSGAHIVHFGAPMDIPQALAKLPATTIVCGNIDPASVFVHGTAETVAAKARELLAAAEGHRNFVISSGCDVPAATPVENLEAFFKATSSPSA
ncbi:MAG TPA: uroporphyrinogen decarboxylase family protein [Bacteroidota bacterium]|nr:uroporphyrinogen decarboxylase family protein [Bacteroidota bacterium]